MAKKPLVGLFKRDKSLEAKTRIVKIDRFVPFVRSFYSPSGCYNGGCVVVLSRFVAFPTKLSLSSLVEFLDLYR